MARNSIFLLVVVFLLLLLLSIKPSHEFQVIKFARSHLKAFGYLSAGYTSVDDIYDAELESALRKYQGFYRLNVTGRVEPDTLTNMLESRCGVPDLPLMDPMQDVTPEYSFMRGKHTWPPSDRALIYWFGTPVTIPIDDLRTAVSSAFSKWSAVTKFTFREDPDEEHPDLAIGFFSGDHGDGHSFDGPGGILAHAFSPMDGRFHYDADEEWSTDPNSSQFDLETIAMHEIGHLLGLGHTTIKGSIMFPTFGRGIIRRDLQPDDINGIHALYPDG